jgi:hypothetical protein
MTYDRRFDAAPSGGSPKCIQFEGDVDQPDELVIPVLDLWQSRLD